MSKFVYGLMVVFLLGLVANVSFAQEEAAPAAPAAEEAAAPVVDEAAPAPEQEAAPAQEKVEVVEEAAPVEEEAVAEAEVEVTVESGCCEAEEASCCDDPCGGSAAAAPRRGPVRRVLSLAVRIATFGRRGV